MRSTCYMCDGLAVTREHVPPKCFFPEGLRTNLFTVPSCAEHNLENSKDVEYDRNILSTQRGNNSAADQIFELTKRSFDHSPKLRDRTFRDGRLVTIEGERTGSFTVDLERHKRVMSAIAYALYFREYGRRHCGDWRVFTPTFAHVASFRGEADPWKDFRQLLDSGTYVLKPAPHPEIFKYEALEMEQWQTMFRFTFYGHTVVNVWTHFQTFVCWPHIHVT
jgi:hypothetical protein